MKWVERFLWTIGFLALAIWLAVWANARRQQAEASRELDRRLKEQRSVQHGLPSLQVNLIQGDVIGRIEIPRLEISTMVFEGTGDDVLGIGVGHLPDSPLPGLRGNVVLAAHRDTFFRPLRNIQKLDTISVVTPGGTHRYSVDETRVVTPDHTEVLGPASGTILTLVTCYPFDWFGHAPQRFIVRAHEVSLVVAAAPEVKAQMPLQASQVMANVDHVPPPRPKPIVQRAPVEEIAAQEEVPAPTPTHHQRSRNVRGVKGLNPKHLWARIRGK
jgi:sortase A